VLEDEFLALEGDADIEVELAAVKQRIASQKSNEA